MTFLEQANSAYREGDFKRSAQLYKKFLLENPSLARLVELNTVILNKKLPEKDRVNISDHKREHLISIKNVASSEVSGQTILSHLVRVPVEEKVSVIVPVYNALDDLKVCIERLLKHTDSDVDIIFINDASPDPLVATVLEEASLNKNIRVFDNTENLGFTRTVNRGIELAGSNDVVLLNSDARVTPRWLQGLKRTLSTDANIATVTPMSDRAGAFSAPNIGNDNNLPGGISEIDYAVAFRRHSVGYYPTVPTGNGFCMYIRRRCLDELGSFDAEAFPRGYGEENDFCMRAGRLGWRHVIDDRTYIFHDRNKSFGEQKDTLIKAGREIVDKRYPEFKKSIRVFSESPLLFEARAQGAKALRELAFGTVVKPRVLFVISTLTGGTPQTNRDLMLSLSDDFEPWLLHCDSKKISLYKVDREKEDHLKKRHELLEPIEPLTHVSHEYDKVLNEWLFEIDFEIVHIRHLAWHSLCLAQLAKKAGAKVIFSFHDYYAVCPTVKLLDEKNKFCGGNCTKTFGDCNIDLWKDKNALPQLKNSWVYKWRDFFKGKVLNYCDEFIATHSSARDIISSQFKIPDEKFHIIPHGRDFDEFYQLADAYQKDEKLKILVPGNIGQPKGRDLIRDLVGLDKGNRLHFHILGKCSLKNKPGLTVHGEYTRDEFASRVREIRPHVGAVLSIWNETWCHTLTELWSVGIPAIVTNFPTLEQRVVESGGGWVVEHSDVQKLYESIAMGIDASEVKRKVDRVIACQDKSMRYLTAQNMAEKYKKVYKSS